MIAFHSAAVTPAADGWLWAGFTGIEQLIDAETLEYAFVSPAGWPQWSADNRYVSVGEVGGHGIPCFGT